MRQQLAAPTHEWAKSLRDKIMALGWTPLYDPLERRIRIRCWRGGRAIVIPPALIEMVNELERPAAAAAFAKFLRQEFLQGAP